MSNLWRVRTALAGGTGADQVSTMFFDQAAGGTAQHAADAVHTFWSSLSSTIITGYTMNVDTIVEDIDIATGKPVAVTSVTAAPITASGASGAMPWATQGLVEWRTGLFLSGREVRGRTFIPGVNGVANAGGVPSSTYLSTLQAAGNALATDVNSSLCIYSRKKRSIGVVTTCNTYQKWAVLRSRRD